MSRVKNSVIHRHVCATIGVELHIVCDTKYVMWYRVPVLLLCDSRFGNNASLCHDLEYLSSVEPCFSWAGFRAVVPGVIDRGM